MFFDFPSPASWTKDKNNTTTNVKRSRAAKTLKTSCPLFFVFVGSSFTGILSTTRSSCLTFVSSTDWTLVVTITSSFSFVVSILYVSGPVYIMEIKHFSHKMIKDTHTFSIQNDLSINLKRAKDRWQINYWYTQGDARFTKNLTLPFHSG